VLDPASAVLGWLMAPGIGEQLPTLRGPLSPAGVALTGVILEFIFSHA
jgi:hypothetical protein